MNSTCLAPDQCRILAAKFSRMQAELDRLVERLYRLGYRHDSELQNLTGQTLDNVRELRMQLHELTDGQGC